MPKKKNASSLISELKRKTRRNYSSEEKIRIIIEGMRGEITIAELCRKEGLSQGLYYKWSKDFMEAGKKGDIVSRSEKSRSVLQASKSAMCFFRYSDTLFPDPFGLPFESLCPDLNGILDFNFLIMYSLEHIILYYFNMIRGHL